MLSGLIHLELTGADIPGFLTYAGSCGVVLYSVCYRDLLHVSLQVSRSDHKRLRRLAARRGTDLEVVRVSGLYWQARQVLCRPVLLGILCLLLFLTFWLPTKVLFIRVEGNSTVPTHQILSEAEKCGVYFGASRSAVRSERVKNNLLEALPQLQWAGINTSGCVAVISVREDGAAVQQTAPYSFSSIVADRDGIILSGTVTSGTPQFTVGQAVKAGQTLVSGWQDLGLVVKTTRSEAEIFAQTSREQTVDFPLCYEAQGETLSETKIFSLIIGKKRINLSKGSGISYTGCDKIYEEYYLTLPGGFVLPMALCVERLTETKKQTVTVDTASAQSIMEEYSDAYLLGSTVSGRILQRLYTAEQSEEKQTISARYICTEMIGRERGEEIEISYGENHGKDR